MPKRQTQRELAAKNFRNSVSQAFPAASLEAPANKRQQTLSNDIEVITNNQKFFVAHFFALERLFVSIRKFNDDLPG
jgi:hypothetical protein